MYFRQILHEEKSCASYLIGCPTRGVSAVIDPQGDPEWYVREIRARGMSIQAVIETHLHADHVSCARELSALVDVPLYLGCGAQAAYHFHPLDDGQIVEIGNRRMRALHTPGHTPEHLCLLVDDWFVLTGDTLFVGDVGRVDLTHGPGDDSLPIQRRAQQLYHSLQRLMALPDWVEVYPGHYAGSVCGRGMDGKPISTIGRERQANPALRLSADAFIDFQQSNLPPFPQDFHQIKARNLGHA